MMTAQSNPREVLERLGRGIELHRTGESISGYHVSHADFAVADVEALLAIIERLNSELERKDAALKPFAEAYDESQQFGDFDGRDCRLTYVINAVGLSDFEEAHAALHP